MPCWWKMIGGYLWGLAPPSGRLPFTDILGMEGTTKGSPRCIHITKKRPSRTAHPSSIQTARVSCNQQATLAARSDYYALLNPQNIQKLMQKFACLLTVFGRLSSTVWSAIVSFGFVRRWLIVVTVDVHAGKLSQFDVTGRIPSFPA